MREIKFGLFDIMQVDPLEPASHAAVYAQHLDNWALADELGFTVAFVAERHFMPMFRSTSATAWLAAASQRTRSMRIGSLAWTLPVHQPVQLAEETAVLDQFSNGRLEVGLGLGHREEELVALGVDPKRKIEIFQNRLAVMRSLWLGEHVDVESDSDIVRGVTINPLPVQQPGPPLWFAGTAPQAAAWAGANGLNFAFGFAPAIRLKAAADEFRTADRQASGSDGELRLALMRHVYISDTLESAMSDMADDLTRLGEWQISHGLRSRAVSHDEASAEAQSLLDQQIFIAGDPASVAGQIRNEADLLGFDLFLANPWGAAISNERVERTMQYLAGPVRQLITGDS